MAKGPSAIQQKALQARKRMYTPAQAMAYEPCPCDPKMVPHGDDNLSVRGPGETICPTCFTVPAENGTCLCD